MNYTFAALFLILTIVIAIYIIIARVRKTRLSRFQWTHVISLLIICFMNGVGMFSYFGVPVDEDMTCRFVDDVDYGISDIMLFNVCVFQGFKLYTVTKSFHDFAIHGRLPSRKLKKRNKIIMRVFWAVSIIDVLVFVIMNIYWTFINRDIAKLYAFIFANRSVQIVMIFFVCTLFFLAYRTFGKTLAQTIVNSKSNYRLFRARKLMLTMGVLYLMLDLAIFLDIYTEGLDQVSTLI